MEKGMLRWAEIHLKRLLSNYRTIKKITRGKKIYAVVKANAYGHGSVAVSRFLEKYTDIWGFAVATCEEGAELRESGIKKEILVMASGFLEERSLVKKYALTPVVSDFEDLRAVKEIDVPFHVKIDTGMGRLGFLEKDWERLLEELCHLPVSGVMSHFSCADTDEEFTDLQYRRFLEFVGRLKKIKKEIAVHIENSAGILAKFDSSITHCRIGLALYGVPPVKNFPGLTQVMEVKAKVLSVKELPPGFPVSYHGTYRTKKRERIAVVAFGYADGLPRSLSNKGSMIVKGKRCPIRGTVCMDMTVISVDKNVEKGDTVVVTGPDIPFGEIAEIAGTIPYEIMCGIGLRVKRIYREF